MLSGLKLSGRGLACDIVGNKEFGTKFSCRAVFNKSQMLNLALGFPTGLLIGSAGIDNYNWHVDQFVF